MKGGPYKLSMTGSTQERRQGRGSMAADAAKNVRTRIENVKLSLNEAGKSSNSLADKQQVEMREEVTK